MTDGDALYFRNLPLGELNSASLSSLLQARTSLKQVVFKSSVLQLEKNPQIADVPPCVGESKETDESCLLINSAKSDVSDATNNPVTNTSKAGVNKRVALVIGVNQYQDKSIPQLLSATPDAQTFAKLLETEFGYQTNVLIDPSKQSIVKALNQATRDLGENDSVVIYYAGHGELIEKTGLGYWIPADAKSSDPKGWISNTDIQSWLTQVRAKQVVLIADSCYSGTFAGRTPVGDTSHLVERPEALRNQRSVTTMSSGSDEPVADTGNDGHSVFAWSLIKRMAALQQWEPGSKVFEHVQTQVERELPQSPQYGAVVDAGHKLGADFLFEKQKKKSN
jgi:uncharacterized caspase-like protein